MSGDCPPERPPFTSSGSFKSFSKLMDAKSKASSVGRNGQKAAPAVHKGGQVNAGTPEPSRRSKKSGNFNIYGRSMSHPECVSSRLERARAYGQNASERNRRKATSHPSKCVRRVQSSGNALYSEPTSDTVEYRVQHPSASSKCTSYFDNKQGFQLQDWINSSITMSDMDPLDTFSPSSGQDPNLMSSTCISDLISGDSYHVDRGVQTTLESGSTFPINKSKLCPIRHWDSVSGEPIQEVARSNRHRSRSASRFEAETIESKASKDESDLRNRVEGLKQSVAAMRQEARMLKLQTEEKVLLKEMAALTTYLSNTRIVLSSMDERYQDPVNSKNSIAASHTDELLSPFVRSSSSTDEIIPNRQEKCAAQGSILKNEMDHNCLREALNNVEKGIDGCSSQALFEQGTCKMVENRSPERRQNEGSNIRDGNFIQASKLNRTGYVRVGSMPERRKEDWNLRLDRTLDSFDISEEVDDLPHNDHLRTGKEKDVLEAQIQNACIVEHVEWDKINLEVGEVDKGHSSKTSSNCDGRESDSQAPYEGEDLVDAGSSDAGYTPLDGTSPTSMVQDEDAENCQNLPYTSQIEEGQLILPGLSVQYNMAETPTIGQDPKESGAETDSVKSLDTARTWIVPEDILNSGEDVPEETPNADGEDFSTPLESNRESVSSRELVTRTDPDYIAAFVEAIMALFLRNIPEHMQDHSSPVPWKVFVELQSARKPNKDQQIFDKCIFEALNEVVRETYRMCNRVKGLLENGDEAVHCIPLPSKHKWITDAKEKILCSVHHRSVHYDAIGAVLSQDAWYLHNSMMDIESEINQLQSNVVV